MSRAGMSVIGAGRHTMAEEETGRAELIRAGASGRRAPGAAVMLVALFSNVLIGGLSVLALVSAGLAAPDSVAVGAGMALVGLTFAALAVTCAQLVSHARTAMGLAMLGLGDRKSV